MLLDNRGHLKLTDLGLCKKVGEASPSDHPEVVLDVLKKQTSMETDLPQDSNTELNGKPAIFNDPKARREMAVSTVGTPDYIGKFISVSDFDIYLYFVTSSKVISFRNDILTFSFLLNRK